MSIVKHRNNKSEHEKALKLLTILIHSDLVVMVSCKGRSVPGGTKLWSVGCRGQTLGRRKE